MNFDTHFNFTLDKVALVLGFALLSFMIVLGVGLSNDLKFMTVFTRSIKAFFVAGIAAFIAVGVLSFQEKYFGISDDKKAAEAPPTADATQAAAQPAADAQAKPPESNQ